MSNGGEGIRKEKLNKRRTKNYVDKIVKEKRKLKIKKN